jgi:hypothetical protein
MAYAMKYEVYKSMDALEPAVEVEPAHFFAQLKYAELQYRLRALIRAEQETIKALDLATNSWELSLARKQLQADARRHPEAGIDQTSHESRRGAHGHDGSVFADGGISDETQMAVLYWGRDSGGLCALVLRSASGGPDLRDRAGGDGHGPQLPIRVTRATWV